MKKVTVVIESTPDGKFWGRTEQEINGDTMLNSCGDCVEAVKEDMDQCYSEAKQDAKEEGKDFEEVEFEYKYDLQSFFDYFSFFNANELARRANINPSLMRQYKSGIKKAGEKTYSKLAECVAGITKDLQAAHF